MSEPATPPAQPSLALGTPAVDPATPPVQTPTEPVAPPTPAAPAIPDKFKGEDGSLNQEAILKAYAELEGKLGTGQATPPPATPEGDTPSTDEAVQALDEAGLDYQALEAEFLANGELSETTYETLTTKGLPKEMVDRYIAGVSAIADKARVEALEAIGGPDKFTKIAEWARAGGMTADEIAEFDGLVSKPGTAQIALQGIAAKYADAVGVEANLISGKSTTDFQGFRTDDELQAAMMDPRYRTSPSYRMEVERKAALSL